MNQQKEKAQKTLNQTCCAKSPAKQKENGATDEPRRKYGAHKGLKFIFNTKKLTANPFTFDTELGNEKGETSTYEKNAEKPKDKEFSVQISKEKVKISEESDGGQNEIRSFANGDVPEDSITTCECNNDFCVVAVESLRLPITDEPLRTSNCAMNQQRNSQISQKEFNAVKPQTSNTMKSSKQPFDVEKPQPSTNTRKSQKEPLDFEKPQPSTHTKKSQKEPLDFEKPQPSTNTKKSQKQPLEFEKTQPSTNIRKSQKQPFDIEKSQSSNRMTLQKQAFDTEKPLSSKFVKSAKSSIPQLSLAQTDSKIIHKKYGAHAGLKFNLHVTKPTAVVQPFSFENRNSRSKKSITNDEGEQTQGRETNAPESDQQNRV